MLFVCILFFKQKTAYEMRISDWSSDVCSSDLAIERVKYAAYEIGANCIVGLSIDMDEISGKGKSMFMLTAIGTAVIIEKEVGEKVLPKSDEKLENVGVDRINVLRRKRDRKSVEEGKRVSVRLDLGGSRIKK